MVGILCVACEFLECLPPSCFSWSASKLFLMVCLQVISHGLPPSYFSWSASKLFLMVCLQVISHGLPPSYLSWSASKLFLMVCLQVVSHGLPPSYFSWSASKLFLMVCLQVISHGLPPSCFSWSASKLFLMVCLQVISRGLPPTVPWGRDHCPSIVGHLFSHLVDLMLCRICILPDVDNDVLYQGDFFVGPEDILCRTLGQLAEVYGGEHPV